MIDFIIKSTISLGFLYLFYLIFLRDLKTFKFNRYFLLVSLIFSLIVPLISIPLDFDAISIAGNNDTLKNISSTVVQLDEEIIVAGNKKVIASGFLPYIYGIVSLILFGRFMYSLFFISRLVRGNERIKKSSYCIVVDKNCIIPYTFFSYIIVNKDEYNNESLDPKLMQHEIVHARQWHSVDIVLVEFFKVFMWVNPFAWLLKKQIQLNHEYLADSSVLLNTNIIDYQKVLMNAILKNNAGLLVSNFNFSLTKQRLKMMTKQFSNKKAVTNILVSGILVLFLGIVLAFGQKKEFKYKLSVDGIIENYTKSGIKQSDFAMMTITTNSKKIDVKKFEVTLARGKRAVHYNKQIQGNQFDLKYYSDDARDGDRIVIEILELSDKKIELTQFNSIITIPIDFDK